MQVIDLAFGAPPTTEGAGGGRSGGGSGGADSKREEGLEAVALSLEVRLHHAPVTTRARHGRVVSATMWEENSIRWFSVRITFSGSMASQGLYGQLSSLALFQRSYIFEGTIEFSSGGVA
eukprot:188362-Prorocentrum_minimum.AAC.1